MIELILFVLFIFFHQNNDYEQIAQSLEKQRVSAYSFRTIFAIKHEENKKERIQHALFSPSSGSVNNTVTFLERSARFLSSPSSPSSVFDSQKNKEKILLYQSKSISNHSNGSPFIQLISQICLEEDRRGKIQKILRKYLQNTSASLVEGMLLGATKDLDWQLKSTVRAAGVSHILSASGANVSFFLLMNSPYFWRKFGKFFTGFVSIIFVLTYLSIAGCSASLVRASISAVLLLVGSAFSRKKPHRLWVCVLTVSMMLFVRPEYLTDIGFQLSVAASLALITYSEKKPDKIAFFIDQTSKKTKKICYHSRTPSATRENIVIFTKYWTNTLSKTMKDAFFLTLTIQLWTTPITITHFGDLSFQSLLSNAAVLWLVPIITGLGALTFFAGAIHFHIAAVLVGLMTTFCTQLFLLLVHFFASWTVLTVTLSVDQRKLFLFAYIPLFLIFFVSKRVRKEERWRLYCCKNGT